MIKLSELTDVLFRVNETPMVYVCDCEIDNPEEFNFEEYSIFTIQGMLKTEYYMQPKYANAVVSGLYALEQDKFIVEIDCED